MSFWRKKNKEWSLIDEKEPCPYCGSDEYDYLYSQNGEVIGCDECIEREVFL